MNERLSQFVREHFVLIFAFGIGAFFVTLAFLGPKPPPRPPQVVTLSAEDRKFITDAISSAVELRNRQDGGTAP